MLDSASILNQSSSENRLTCRIKISSNDQKSDFPICKHLNEKQNHFPTRWKHMQMKIQNEKWKINFHIEITGHLKMLRIKTKKPGEEKIKAGNTLSNVQVNGTRLLKIKGFAHLTHSPRVLLQITL